MRALCLPLLVAAAWAMPSLGADSPETAGNTPSSGHGMHAAHQGHGRRGAKAIDLGDTTGARITFWQPDLVSRALVADGGPVVPPRSGMADYHALVAEWERPDGKDALVRYESFRGKPSGRSPRELLSVQKTELEIVPDPIPREHYRYHAGETWGFLVRFRGSPLPGATLVLETEHGSRLETSTDGQGRAKLRLPDDFPEVLPGRDVNSPSRMTLRATHREEGMRYSTALSADYHADPAHWRSVPWGTGVAALGLLAGLTGTLRRRNGKGGAKP